MAESSVFIALRRTDALRSTPAWEQLVATAVSTLRSMLSPGTPVQTDVGPASALVLSGRFVAMAVLATDGPLDVVPTGSTVILEDGQVVAANRLLGHADPRRVERELARVVSPFACLVRDRSSDDVLAGVDALGMRHVYFGSSRDVSVVGSSAAVIAAVLNRGLDPEGLMVLSQLGHFLGEQTAFDGINKIARGELVRLTGRGLEVQQPSVGLPQVVRRGGHFESLPQAVEEGARLLRQVGEQMSAAFPDAVLELSGGLDSRLVLASLPGRSDAPRRTLTIGDPDSDDMRIARRIVSSQSLDGSFIPFTLINNWGGDELFARVRRAAIARDFSSNPMAGAIYDFVSEEVPAGAQFTGAAGEQARGRYYAGQRRAEAPDPNRVEQVVRWQLALNQAVDRSLLEEEFRQNATLQVRKQAWLLMEGVEGAWPAATDHIYMFGRMQRWAGPAYSHWHVDRAVLAPFFHPYYVDWASRLPVPMKRNASAFLGVLETLDPTLFGQPLANGLTPRQLATVDLAGRVLHGRRNLRRLVKKVRQRLANRRHVPAGVGWLSNMVADALRADPPASLAEVAWIDQRGMERFLDGGLELDPVSVSFLVNVAGATGLRESGDSRL